MKLYHLFLFIIISLTVNSCSLYPPISESLIFNEDSNFNNNSKLISFPRMALSKSIVNSNIPKKYLKKNTMELYTNSLNKLWQFSFSSYGFLYRANSDLYIGLNPNLIFNAGIDLTYEIVDDYFITAEATLLKNYKLILQKRVFEYAVFSNTIGIVYRRDRFGFEETSFSKNSTNFYTNSIGIRSLNGFNFFNNEMILEISVLYELEYKAEIINLSFSYSLFNIFNLTPNNLSK